jgi:hypothetical protein
METPSTATPASLKVSLAEAAPVLKKAKGRKQQVRFEHRAFVSTLLEFMRRTPDKMFTSPELQEYMQAQTGMGFSGVANHIAQMRETKAIRLFGGGRHVKYRLARPGDASPAVRPAKVVKAVKAVKASRAPAIDNDEQLLNQFLSVLVQMEGWAQRQRKRDAHYRKLLAMLKEVE